MPRKKAVPVDKKERIKAYIEEAVQVVVNETPMIHFFMLSWRKEKTNSHNGDMSVRYIPGEFDAVFSFYKSIFDVGISDEKSWRMYILRVICHEAGHCYIWKLHGPHDHEEEEAASLIGITLLDLIEKKYDVIMLKRLRKEKSNA